MPAELAEPPTPQTTWVYANDGKTLITSFYDESRKEVSLDEIADVMEDAVVAAEDKRFYEHNGVDPFGVIRAGVANRGAGETSQGASTLTMQYVRQALTYNATSNEDILEATEDTPERKLREMRYAVSIEQEMSKDEILERYLNLVFLGNQSYGIYAAAHAYFNKKPSELELTEAAMLAALPKAPGTIDPTLDDEEAGENAKARRNYVLDGMVDTKAITKKEAEEAKATEVELDVQDQPSECVSVPSNHLDWGFFCDYLKNWWMNNPDFGKSPDDRLAKLKQGGYKIVTSLDPKLQEKAQKHVLDEKGVNDPFALGTLTLDPKTGQVRSMALNRNFKLDDSKNHPNSNPNKSGRGSYPNTTVPLLTGGNLDSGAGSGFQAGSTFKLFTMVAALNEGMSLSKTYGNNSPYASKEFSAGWEKSDATCGKHLSNGSYAWCVKNATPSWMDGKANMWKGFGRSINTYFVQLIEEVGAKNVVRMAQNMGIEFRNSQDLDWATDGCDKNNGTGMCLEPENWGTFTLGVADTVALDVAESYGTIAASGKHCKPTPVTSITTPAGEKLKAGEPDCDSAVNSSVADAAADAMRCPVGDKSHYGKCDGGTYEEGHKTVKRPLIGKTGTTDSDKASWYANSTPNATTVGFMADPDYRDRPIPEKDVNDPHKAASKTLRDAVADLDKEDFPKPPSSTVYGKNAKSVPKMDCVSPEEAESKLSEAGFKPKRADGGEQSRCEAGKVYRTSPTDKAPKGATVNYYVSEGKKDAGDDKDYVPPVHDDAPGETSSAEPHTQYQPELLGITRWNP